MNQVEVTASVTAIANMLSCRLTDDELTLAGAVFTQLGDTLATISATRAVCQSRDKKRDLPCPK